MSVLCRARTACTRSLMCGFLLRRRKDFRHCSWVRKRCCPVRDSPPCLRHRTRLSRSSPPASARGKGGAGAGGQLRDPAGLPPPASPCPEGVGLWGAWDWKGP